jgi:hypothetical protein
MRVPARLLALLPPLPLLSSSQQTRKTLTNLLPEVRLPPISIRAPTVRRRLHLVRVRLRLSVRVRLLAVLLSRRFLGVRVLGVAAEFTPRYIVSTRGNETSQLEEEREGMEGGRRGGVWLGIWEEGRGGLTLVEELARGAGCSCPALLARDPYSLDSSEDKRDKTQERASRSVERSSRLKACQREGD